MADEHAELIDQDPGVRAVVRVLDVLEGFVLAEWLYYLSDRFVTVKFNYRYVAGWLAALGVILATSDAWAGHSRALVWTLFGVAAWRMFDITRWWADFLFDRSHKNLVSAERSLLFAVANLAEIVVVGAIWLRVTGQATTAGNATFQAFSLVTQLNLPPAGTVGAKVSVALTEVAALLLILGGVASLIALVPAKFHATGEYQGRPKGRRERRERVRLFVRRLARGWRRTQGN